MEQTDAQGFGHVAAAFTTDGRAAVSTRLPQWFLEWVGKRPDESPIFFCELRAAILLAYCARDWHGVPRTCMANKAAVATLVKEPPASRIGALLANLLRTVATQGGERPGG